MRRLIVSALCLLMLGSVRASDNQDDMTTAFIAKEGDKIIRQEGACAERHSPCSSFKIFLSLIGFDAEILKDENTPEWGYSVDYETLLPDVLDIWKKPYTPAEWMKFSCVWYSQVLTQMLGMEKFKDYVTHLDYGNQDVSGDKGKNNGLTHSWLCSSLEISPLEQISFLEKLVQAKLPLSKKAHELTKKLLLLEELPNGWKLYGKTGSGYLKDKEGTLNRSLQQGWFVGWIQKDQRTIVFASYIQGQRKPGVHGGQRAKSTAKEKLLEIIN